MDIEEKIEDCMDMLCADKYKKGRDWNGYEVYEPINSPEGITGPPWVVLVKNEEVRISTPEESFAYDHFLYAEKCKSATLNELKQEIKNR